MIKNKVQIGELDVFITSSMFAQGTIHASVVCGKVLVHLGEPALTHSLAISLEPTAAQGLIDCIGICLHKIRAL